MRGRDYRCGGLARRPTRRPADQIDALITTGTQGWIAELAPPVQRAARGRGEAGRDAAREPGW